MTPTFAAGLGVVIAAAMSANVPSNVLTFGKQFKGQPCATPGCVPDNGGLASAKPGQRLVKPSHSPSATSTRHGDAQSGTLQTVAVRYQTLQQDGHGDFSGQIVIDSRPGHPLRNWTFQFTYPDAQIMEVWAGSPVPHDAHSATVTAQGGSGWAGASQVQITFSVSGPAGPPAGCTFDGHACRYTVSQGSGGGSGNEGSPGGGGGQGGSHGPGGYGAGPGHGYQG